MLPMIYKNYWISDFAGGGGDVLKYLILRFVVL